MLVYFTINRHCGFHEPVYVCPVMMKSMCKWCACVSEILTVFTLMSTHECLHLTFKRAADRFISVSLSCSHTDTQETFTETWHILLDTNFTDLNPVCFMFSRGRLMTICMFYSSSWRFFFLFSFFLYYFIFLKHFLIDFIFIFQA